MKPWIEQIDHVLSGFAWRLWNTLGVAGAGSQSQDCFIDLEALILLTSVLGKSDPRLLAEALDWCSKYHGFVSISRLKTLIEELGPQIHVPVSLFAETLNSIAQSKWPVFAKTSSLRIALSKKSRPPNCKQPALLSLRLRVLFGVGARADLITFFITQQPTFFSAADTVEIGYSKRTLADVLDDFVEAGVLTSSMVRNQKQYQISSKEHFLSLAGELPTIVPNWGSLLMVLITLREVFSKHQKDSVSSVVVALRNAFASLKDHLQKLNVSPPPLSSDSAHWESYVQQTVDLVKSLSEPENFKPVSMVDDFERTVFSFMQHLYKVDDCIDGLNFIIDKAVEHPAKHQKVFKECYQMSVCYLEELQSRLEDLLKFPIQPFRDLKLTETVHQFSQESMQPFLQFVKKAPPSASISTVGLSLNWYKILEVELNRVRRFIDEIKKRLKELHFHKTNIHLLSQPVELYKRHSVLKLFSAD